MTPDLAPPLPVLHKETKNGVYVLHIKVLKAEANVPLRRQQGHRWARDFPPRKVLTQQSHRQGALRRQRPSIAIGANLNQQ